MKNSLICLILCCCGALLHASPILTLNPNDIAGQPGQTVGWGFDLTPDTLDWTTITGLVEQLDGPSIPGFFMDLVSPQGGPDGGLLDPGAPDWTESFDPVNQTGLASFSIDPSATPGSGMSGQFLVLYETFSFDPRICGDCFVSSGALTAPFSLDVPVSSAVPEPETITVVAMGLLLGLLGMYRRHR